jgi:hypothetical protein
VPEREEPDLDRVRDALRQHDERPQPQRDDDADTNDEPPEPAPDDDSP